MRWCTHWHVNGTPEFVNAFVRSKAHAIEQDVQKLRIVQDPKNHYDLLRFCQHTRLAFLARNVPPDVMMRAADAGFVPGRGDWGSGILQRSKAVPVPVLIQSSIVHCARHSSTGSRSHFRLSHLREQGPRIIMELTKHEGAWWCAMVTHFVCSRILRAVSIYQHIREDLREEEPDTVRVTRPWPADEC
jgi:hypothetical protein